MMQGLLKKCISSESPDKGKLLIDATKVNSEAILPHNRNN